MNKLRQTGEIGYRHFPGYMDMLLFPRHDSENVWNDNRQKLLCALLINDVFCCMDKLHVTVKTPVMFRDHQIYRICHFIHQHYREKITLEELSEVFFIARTTLTLQFRKIVGVSVNEYIQKVRCDHGMQALKAGKSVQEASELSGYKDVSFFIRVFEGIYGISPKQYSISLRNDKTVRN